ncbi:hypothetical protein [Sinorhizobium meliloti]|uniref:hypothetical protein n=1 Tax=Rhizobium meliloti TaxID=382 RepID=UPI000FDA3CD5|nr:hypothetical protein [Sinorhizobium meliloti]RVM04189.1 hypothetical protein CN134_32105 [Sinorhizobium meliloti]RVO23331.1 hypothetical protein CN098_30155 [Sinorhizobium meliloti]
MAGKRQVRRLQILLHEHCRSRESRAAAKVVVHELGMTISGEGKASLSVRMSEADFKELFSELSGGGDTLAVPDKLKPFVSSISEAPEHLSFD